MATSRRSSLNALIVISAIALCVILPFAELGIPSGHDFEFHFNSWIEIVDHWRQGTFYPHWAALAHYGYGEARFIFYPPLSWTCGAILGIVLPWKFAPVAYIWIVLALAGFSMYVLARNWLQQRDAIFAAALYAANPYNLVIVYWRSALAELMAAIYLPLLLLLILRAEEDGRRMVVPLAVLMGLGWLTNLPSAVMMNYSLAVLAITVAFWRRSFRALLYPAIAAGLGAMLAGFYLLPAFHEKSWVNIAEVLGPGVRPLDNFLFTKTADADHNRFNLLISIVAVAQFAILAGVVAFRGRSPRYKVRPLLLVWSIFCVLLMLKLLLPVWIYLPEMKYVQLPWRWLLCFNVPFSLAIAFKVRRWWIRGAIYVAALAVLLVVWHRVQVPWWDSGADLKEMVDNQHDGIGNEGVDEYVPAGADPYEIDQNAPLVRFEGSGDTRINVQQWLAERRVFAVNASDPGNVVLRLFNYPSWKVRVNGAWVKTGTTAHTGQMTVPVGAGQSEVEIKFVQGRDRIVGIVCSAVALAVLLIFLIFSPARRCFTSQLTAQSS